MKNKIKKTKDRMIQELHDIAEGKIGPGISFSKAKCDKVRDRARDKILDMSAPSISIDVNSKDIEDEITESKLHPVDSIVFYMRMKKDLLDYVKQKARERSYMEQTDITYQMLINEAIEEKYLFQRKKDDTENQEKK